MSEMTPITLCARRSAIGADDVANGFTEGVERGGADIAVDNADGRECQTPEAAFGVIGGGGVCGGVGG